MSLFAPGEGVDAVVCGSEDDPGPERLIGFLRSVGAARLDHGRGRSLLDHLLGTSDIVRRWRQPPHLQRAALLHSVYGTYACRRQLVAPSRRADVIELAGARAERLAYLFSVVPRDLLFAGTYAWARDLPGLSREAGVVPGDQRPATRAELDELVLLHMADTAEQARAADGAPGRWLVQVRKVAELLIGSDAVTLPLFVAELAACSEADELLALRAYRHGLTRAEEREAMASELALAAAACPVVAEPCVWLAYLSVLRGDPAAARAWARCARRRFDDLGTTWDKRLDFEEWLALARRFEQASGAESRAWGAGPADPRSLMEAVCGVRPGVAPRAAGSGGDAVASPARFHRYVEAFADADTAAMRGRYPDLDSQPWYDPADFPLARYLEANYEAIRAEILALDPSAFHRESERIGRSSELDVAFLYERGRRRDEICEACPTLTRGIDSYPAMRTAAGLIYASRMRPGTHIAPHRGPTNLRVRCHLPLEVPAGDCAIRVGDETRRWHEGRCVVFQDYFEHEAWNLTGEDRTVLIVDMWHPGLSPTEVHLLEGLHRYAYRYARRLDRYWSSSEDAAAGASSPASR
jgi:aspartate beta-hydroxylase